MAHSPARALDVGSVIAGTYTIEGLLGKGGMGAVFVASHARLPGKKVAVKVLHPDVADGDSMARFKREAEIASRLGHANIVEVHDWNELPDGTPYIVYELLEGESLSDRLRRGPMPVEEVMSVVRQVGSALAAAHREHIVHRDLKPQNIFLVAADDGISMKAKVLDFGISKIRGSTTVKTQDTAMLGTPQYMAPEQAMGRQDQIDARTDVFAFGAVVYEMLAGAPAFEGTTIPEVVFKVVYEETPDLAARAPGAPPHVVAAVHKALAKKPAERWPDVGTFVEALTGSPLASGRRNIVNMTGAGGGGGGGTAVGTGVATAAGGERTGEDAFAATMGSGDHASAMAASMRASMAAAQTVASTPPSANVPSPIPRKSKLPLVLGIVGLVAAAAIAAVVMAGGKKTEPVAGGEVPADAAVVASAVVIDAAAVEMAPDAAPAPVDAGTSAPPAIDGGVRKPKIDAGTAVVTPPDDPPDPPDGGGDDPDDADPELRELLAEARRTLASDPDEALRAAKRITTRFPKAQAAWAIRAQANCALGDQEQARADSRRIRRPVVMRQVRKACRSHGIDI